MSHLRVIVGKANPEPPSEAVRRYRQRLWAGYGPRAAALLLDYELRVGHEDESVSRLSLRRMVWMMDRDPAEADRWVVLDSISLRKRIWWLIRGHVVCLRLVARQWFRP